MAALMPKARPALGFFGRVGSAVAMHENVHIRKTSGESIVTGETILTAGVGAISKA
jgi:hypothetical protein